MRLIYKYSSWRNANTIYHDEIITKNSLYFSSANQFNDPFDSSLPVLFKNNYGGSEEYYLELFTDLVKRELITLNPQAIPILAKAHVTKNGLIKKEQDDLNLAFSDTVNTEFGICCFTKKQQKYSYVVSLCRLS